MPQNSNFWQKIEVTVMLPNHGGNPLGFILGPMGSHWVQNMGQNRKNLPFPKIPIFRKKSKLRLWHQITVGTPLGPSWGQWGPIGSKKSNFWLPRGHRFFAKNRSYGYGAKSRWGPPRVRLGANGVPLGPKNGSKP